MYHAGGQFRLSAFSLFSFLTSAHYGKPEGANKVR